jgi:hypothetical protein
MSALRVPCLLTAGAIILIAADLSWKSKPMPDWTEEDARQILTDSPWARTVKGVIGALQTEDQRREGGNMGMPRGIGYDGLADDRPRPDLSKNPLDDLVRPESKVPQARPLITLQLRWESALPIRVAELKSHAVEPPTSEGGGDAYIMAVYGIPSANVKGDPKSLGEPLKSQAVLKREGKKDVKPSSVEVFQREDGLVIVYVFPLSAEITKKDQRIEFVARIGRVGIAQSFDVVEMQFQGRLEM